MISCICKLQRRL